MNGLLVRHAEIWKNIGDYIQSLAQEQFWDHIDTIVDREHTDVAHSTRPGEKINLIMNSWWMWSPENFPPSEDINPFFISFHISPSIEKRLMREESVAYFKKYQPIGARDKGTAAILEKYGIQSYFSGCLTLTLGKSYASKDKSELVYFVDPEYKLFNPRAYGEWLRTLWFSLRWMKRINALEKKFIFSKKTVFSRISSRLNKRICTTLFYLQYRRFFDDGTLLNAEYVTHRVNVKRDYPTDEACLEYARVLVRKYARARMVITSKIHAALPCLGLGTPVCFVRSMAIDSGIIKGRLDGLIDFFNYQLQVTNKGLYAATEEMVRIVKNGPITPSTKLVNSEAFIPYRDRLIQATQAFVDTCRKLDSE